MITNVVTNSIGTPWGTPSTQILNLFGSTVLPTTTTINEYTVMTVPAVWRAVNFFAQTLAALPKSIYQRQGDTREKAKHSQNILLSLRPSRVGSAFKLFETAYYHKKIWGNGYIGILRNSANEPISYHNLNPELTCPFISNGEKYYFFDCTDLTNLPPLPFVDVTDANGNSRKGFALHSEDVIHFYGLGFDGVRGYPPVCLMRDALQAGKSAEQHTTKFFTKGGFIRGTVQIPGILTDAQLATMKQSIAAIQANNDGGVEYAILQANAKLENSTLPNETAQLIETRRFAIADIARLFGLPPHILYEMGDAKWANVEQLSLEVVKYSLTNDIIADEQELTLKLLTTAEQDAEYYVRYNVDGLLRGDQESRKKFVIDIVNNGLATPNWGAGILDLPPLGPDGDVLRMPVSQAAPVNSGASAAPEAPKPAAAAADDDAANEATEAVADDASTEAADSGAYAAAVLEPLLRHAAASVEAKTDKAFANREGKPEAEMTPWANVFAEQQKRMVLNELLPIAVAAKPLGVTIDAAKIADAYAAEVRRFAATKDKGNLYEIAKGVIYGTN